MFVAAASQLVLAASAQDPADTAFWNSAFAENHVLDIRIEVTREAWDAMQPPAQSRRQRGRRGRDEGDQQHRGKPYSYKRARITNDGQRFEDAGHWVHFEEPERVSALLHDFLSTDDP